MFIRVVKHVVNVAGLVQNVLLNFTIELYQNVSNYGEKIVTC